jgi:16S rRNA processing protein RimM
MVESAPEQVIVGEITAVYGIKGWVKVHSYTDPDTNILGFRNLLIQSEAGWTPVTIDQGRRHGKGLVAHIVGCDDRNAAALLTRRELAVSAAELPEPAADEVYWRELEGMAVYSVSDERQRLLGRVGHLFATGANDVMVVEPTADSIDGRERLIPWVSEQFIREIDRPGRKILVDWDPEF